jgi:hypothetical protein
LEVSGLFGDFLENDVNVPDTLNAWDYQVVIGAEDENHPPFERKSGVGSRIGVVPELTVAEHLVSFGI